MKKHLIVILVILGTLGSCDQPVDPIDCAIHVDNTESSKNIDILFIGTSHTYYNDMPKLVQKLAKSIGDSVYTEMSAPGGYDFERHIILQGTLDALDARDFDYIVLQESGWRTALPLDQLNQKVYPFAKTLKKILSEKQPTAQLILYMTNGYKEGVGSFDNNWCDDEPAVCTYAGMQDRVRATYVELATILDAKIAPSGVVWKSLINQKNDIPLFDPDGIHPSLTGSYAHALTIYSLIRRKELKNVFVPTGVSSENAALIQDAVHGMIFQCSPDWRMF